MSAEQDRNKKINDRFPLEVLNQGKLSVIDEIVDPNAVDHTPLPGYPPTPEGYKQWTRDFRQAFPDLHYEINDTIAEGDEVVQRVTGSGTMRGPFAGMQPSGKHATWTEMHIVRMRNGKVVEHWGQVDQFGMMQQLGFIPAQATGSSTGSSSSTTRR